MPVFYLTLALCVYYDLSQQDVLNSEQNMAYTDF
jgi:hypothetical protein